MNRSNVGNVVTNGMQILSVGAVTASHVFDKGLNKANKSLNNNSPIDKAKLDNINAKTKNLELKNNQLEKKQEETEFDNSKITVDNLLGGVSPIYQNNSEQISDISTKINRDIEFLKRRNLNRDVSGKFTSIEKGGDNNANV